MDRWVDNGRIETQNMRIQIPFFSITAVVVIIIVILVIFYYADLYQRHKHKIYDTLIFM